MDVSGKGFIKNRACPESQYVEIEFFKRGWSGEPHRFSGSVFSAPGIVSYKIEGRWSESMTLINVQTGEKELVWTKPSYPANWEYMYGMSFHTLQFNYLPDSLRPRLAPTDTRLRPD